MRIIWFLLAFYSVSAVCYGQQTDKKKQEIDKKRLDSFFNNLEARNLAIGRIVVMQGGKILYERTVGDSAARGGGTGGGWAGRDAAYRIGSITKLFTAVMVYELIDQKRLSLGDTLGRFFPDLPNAGTITIAEMLGHRSGLADFTRGTANFDSWKYESKTHEQLLAFVRGRSSDFAPGAKADYNNSNFLLLGYMLEKIYHKPYKEIVQERIINKLGLHNTYYGDHAGFVGKEAASYKYSDGKWNPEKAVMVDNFSGAGAMISTPRDLCRFIQAIFDRKFISAGSLSRMTRIEKDGYGWGMFSFGDSLHTGYGHNGQTEGFASSLQYYPERKLAIGYCTNGELYQKDRILESVFKICFDEPFSIPNFSPIKLDRQQMEHFTGSYAGDNGLSVTGSIVSGALVLTVKGQPFELEALSDHEFRNVRFGFFFDFDADGKVLVVRDAAQTYWLNKK